jgi:hypothetical protein
MVQMLWLMVGRLRVVQWLVGVVCVLPVGLVVVSLVLWVGSMGGFLDFLVLVLKVFVGTI